MHTYKLIVYIKNKSILCIKLYLDFIVSSIGRWNRAVVTHTFIILSSNRVWLMPVRVALNLNTLVKISNYEFLNKIKKYFNNCYYFFCLLGISVQYSKWYKKSQSILQICLKWYVYDFWLKYKHVNVNYIEKKCRFSNGCTALVNCIEKQRMDRLYYMTVHKKIGIWPSDYIILNCLIFSYRNLAKVLQLTIIFTATQCLS